MKLKFKAAEPGTTIEIYGKPAKIAGYYISDDNAVPVPCLKTISDFKWQWDCFIDRLFHAWKYEPTENVQESIEHLKQWLVNQAPDEIKADVVAELEEIIFYVNNLEDKYKQAAEIAIQAQMKEAII